MNKPTVSVIVPVYNSEQYLDNCINSVLNQEYTDFELILIDDGSSDSSLDICKKYQKQDKRIVVIHKENEGRCKTRNLGVNKSNGKYIAFLDSDDLYDKHYLKDMVDLLEKYDADMACCKYTRFNNINDIHLDNKEDNNICIYDGNDILKEYFHNNRSEIFPNVWTKVCRRDLFNDVKFTNETFEDLFIIYELLNKSNRIVCTDNSYYLYNIGNSNSVSYNLNRELRIKDRELYIEQISDYFKDNTDISAELNYHIMEEKISIHNDILKCENKPKQLLNKQKSIRSWILENINNELYSTKDKIKIIIRVYFHDLWHLIKKL